MNVDRIQKDEVTFELKRPVNVDWNRGIGETEKLAVTVTHADAKTLWYRLGEVVDR